VGRRQRQEDQTAGGHLRLADTQILGGAPYGELHRWVVAQHLLDDGRRHARVGAPGGKVAWVPQQGEHAVGDQVDRHLVSRHQQ
jgi:hypothetical protein